MLAKPLQHPTAARVPSNPVLESKHFAQRHGGEKTHN